MEARASAKFLRGSPQKARLVIDMIRGKNVNEALAILRYTNKRAALGIEKCVKSAIANANETAEKANISVDPDELWLKGAYVDQGPTKNRRRMRPAPQGRAYRERRHFCHVTILLSSEREDVKARDDGKEEAKPVASKRARRGGAAAAPRAKRRLKAEVVEASAEETRAEEKQQKRTSKAATKAAAKIGSALRRRKKPERKPEEVEPETEAGREQEEE
jgi:large subunit ribosomal protein L22